MKFFGRMLGDVAALVHPSERVTTNISPLTPLTLLLMLPEAHLPPPAIFTARFSAALNAVTIAPGFVRFLLKSCAPFFFEHYCIPRERNGNWPFLFSCLSHLPRSPDSRLSSFSLIHRCSCRRDPCYPLFSPVHPFLRSGTSRGSGSQVTLKNPADGRKIGDTYIIHCARPASLF